jgi:hypothetical protein
MALVIAVLPLGGLVIFGTMTSARTSDVPAEAARRPT